jgi:hypothetical protein
MKKFLIALGVIALGLLGGQGGRPVMVCRMGVCTPQSVSAALQVPGPSVALWNSPPYTCTTNVYVATNGLSTNAGTQVSPYDIITAVTNKSWTAGTCVNIADGTYTVSNPGLDVGGSSNTTTGSSATPTGYVVFRAYQTMDGPHILLDVSQTGNLFIVDNNAKYIWIDGLNLDGQLSATHSSQACLQATGNGSGNLSDGRGSHHVYATNMVLQACGQAGFLGGNTDYEFLLHSTVYNCCWNPTFVLGSGISVYEPLALQGYSGTTCAGGDCTTTKHLAYDDFWCASGAQNSALNVCYSIVVAWNFSYNNYNPQVSGNTSNSDGEGYESDDWAHRQQSCTGLTPGCPFNHNGLTMGNVFYGNGGPGYEVNGTCGPTTTPSCSPAGVILAINNTAAYNGWDPQNGAADWGDFMVLGDAVGIHLINNIAISNNYSHPLFAANNYGFFVDQNNAQCTGTCANTGTEFLSNITFSASNNPNFSFNNTTLTFPTTGTNKNLGNSNANFVNATPMTPNTNAAPTLGNDDIRLQGGSPAISFGQGSFSIWQQTTVGAIDDGACVVNAPGPATICPVKGDSLP